MTVQPPEATPLAAGFGTDRPQFPQGGELSNQQIRNGSAEAVSGAF
jgi:hypothetical protein